MKTLLFAFAQADLIKSLEILWKGLVAVIVVIAIIIAATSIMNLISKKNASRKEKKSDPADSETDTDKDTK